MANFPTIQDDLIIGTSGADTIDALAGNDEVLGGGGGDSLTGNDGDDTLSGEAEDDVLSGGLGNDRLLGGEGSDTLQGGSDNDYLDGAGGADSLEGGAGQDNLSGGEGADTLSDTGNDGYQTQLDGGAGSDVLNVVTSGYGYLYGRAGEDTLTFSGYGGNLIGGEDNDVLQALNGVNGYLYLDGGAGHDTLVMGSFGGFYGDAGNDKITGGNSGNGGSGNDTLTAGGAGYFGGDEGDDSLIGSSGVDTLNGGAGLDTITGGAGTDRFEGQASDFNGDRITDYASGEKIYLFQNLTSASNVQFDTSGADGLIKIDADNDTIFETTLTLQGVNSGALTISSEGGYTNNVIRVIAAGATTPTPEDDFLVGTSGVDTIDALAGNDEVLGGGGADSLAGNDGDDTLSGEAEDDVLSGGLGNDRLLGGEGSDTLQGGSDNDYLDGAGGADSLEGGAGQDNLSGGEGADTLSDTGNDGYQTQLDGGAGSDVLNVVTSGYGYLYGRAGEDTLTFSGYGGNLIGGEDNDVLQALNGVNGYLYLDGGAGHDTLVMGSFGGFYGDAGNDKITGGNSGNGGSGNDTLTAGGAGYFGGDEGDDSLIGSSGVDTLNGGAGLDTITGGAGTDRFEGQASDFNGDRITDYASGEKIYLFQNLTSASNVQFDTSGADGLIKIDADNDTIFETTLTLQGVNSGALTISSEGGYTNNVIRVIAAGATTPTPEDDFLVGTSGVDTIDALAGNDEVLGGGGADSLAGNDGNDTLSGEAEDDVLSGGLGNDRLLGGEGSDTLQGGSDNDYLDGAGGADSLEGGAGQDNLSGGEGADTLSDTGNDGYQTQLDGGAGSDVLNVVTSGYGYLYGRAGEDTLTFSGYGGNLIGGEDNDVLQALNGVNGYLYLDGGAGHDTLVMGSFGGFYGDAGNDKITGGNSGNGGSGNDTLTAGGAGYFGGDEGDDSLIGSSGVDTLNGGAGLDTITGGAGTDRFEGQASDFNGDRITDYASGEKIYLFQNLTSASNVQFDTSGADGLIKIDADNDGSFENVITLQGVTTGALIVSSEGNTNNVIRVITSSVGITTTSVSHSEGNAGGTTYSFTVQRGGDTSFVGTVDWAVTGSGLNAASGADFAGGSLPSGVVTFGISETSKTITFDVAGDGKFEADEGFTVTLSNPSLYTTIASTNASATGAIVNDDAAPTLSIAADQAVKAEGDAATTAFTFTVTRGANTTDAGTVNYAVTGLGPNAANFADFGGALPTGVVSFAAGEDSKTITIDVVGDTVFEQAEGFTVTLSNATGGALIQTATASGTINNDDAAPSLSIAATDAAKAEGNAGTTAYTFTVTRSGDVSQAGTVNYAVTGSGPNAADAADFGAAPTFGQVSFAAGDTSKTVTVNVAGDVAVEQSEGFTVTLSDASGGAIIQTAAASGTIENDDLAPSSGVVLTVGHAYPGEIQNLEEANLVEAVHNPVVGASSSTQFTTSPYAGDLITFQGVGFTYGADGHPTGGVITGLSEYDAGAFVLSVTGMRVPVPPSNADPAAVLQQMFSGHDTEIANVEPVLFRGFDGDDSLQGNVGGDSMLGDAGADSLAGAGGADLLTGGAGDDVIDGGAGSDTVAFSDQRSHYTVAYLQNGDLQFTHKNGGPDGTDIVRNAEFFRFSDGTFDTAGLNSAPTIANQDLATAEDTPGARTVGATDPDNDTLTYIVKAGAGPQHGAVTWDAVDPSKFTYTPTTNFSGGDAFTIQVSDGHGHTVEQVVTVTVSAVNDAPTGAPTGVIANGTANLAQDITKASLLLGFSDVDGDTLNVAGLTAGNGAGTIDTKANGDFTFTPAANFTGPVTLTYTVTDGHGGVVADQTRGFTVVAPPSLAIAATDAAKAEGNAGTTAFTFTVTRSGDASQAGTVDYAVTGSGVNQATAADFGAALPSGQVSFGVGETSKTVTINVAGDTAYEQNEGFTVTLSNATGGASIQTATATGTINNDDTQTFYGIQATVASTPEGASGATPVTFTVTRSGDVSSSSTVQWAVTGSGAVQASGADFQGGALPTGQVSFGVGETSKTITVNIAGDTVLEANEGFTVTLSSPVPSAPAVIQTATATSTIANDDVAPTLSITAADASKAEGNTGSTAFTFTVARSGDVSQAGTVNYAVTGSGPNAATASDFGAALPSGQVSFGVGETSKAITINVAGDTAFEQNEGFTVTLSNATGGATIGTATATGTINNDDAAPSLSIAAASASKAEGNSGSTAFTFTVARTGDATGAATANWAVAGSGAYAATAADFTGAVLPSGVVSFAAGETSKVITVNVAGEAVYEQTEGFTVTLSNPSGAVIGTASAQGTITNDDALPSGGGGVDNLIGSNGPDKLTGGGGGDTLLGDGGADSLDGGAGADRLVGGDGDDNLGGGADSDTLAGDAGQDLLDGGAAADYMIGGAGADTLNGGADSDTLSGGAGADQLSGGAGRDQFQFWSASASTTLADLDRILDWKGSDDYLRFGVGDEAGASLGAGTAANYREFTAADYASALAQANAQIVGGVVNYVAVQVGGDVYVFADGLNNNGTADSAVILAGKSLNDIAQANFV